MSRSQSARARLLAYFLANVGRIMDSEELSAVGAISEWARRVRELKDEHGWQILTHNDRADLKPGQYIMVSPEQLSVAERAISKETRARVLELYGSVCYTCGAIAGEPHPASGKLTVLHMGHLLPKSRGGDDSVPNLRPQCMVCNTGSANLARELPTSLRLIAEIRSAPSAEQVKVFQWLKGKFEPGR